MKAVFFDIDGTLVDSNELHVSAWEQALREGGRLVTREAIRGQIGKGADMLLPFLFPDIQDKEVEALADRHGEIFKERYLHQVQAFPRATDLLEQCHLTGRKVVLASSSRRDEVNYYLALLNARDLVDATVCIDDVERSKPAADIFAAALGAVFPLSAGEAIAVGDTPYDVEAAAKCGVRTIALRSGGFSEAVLQEAGAVAIYSSVKALLESFNLSPIIA